MPHSNNIRRSVRLYVLSEELQNLLTLSFMYFADRDMRLENISRILYTYSVPHDNVDLTTLYKEIECRLNLGTR